MCLRVVEPDVFWLSGLHAPVAGCAINKEIAHVEGVGLMIWLWERDCERCYVIFEFGQVVSHFAGIGSCTKVDELDSAGDGEVMQLCMKVLDFEFHL